MAKCKHEFLMRHEYHGEVWWQCQEGCDFLFREEKEIPFRLLEQVFDKAEKVCEWAWDDCDNEPRQDIAALEAALENYVNFRKAERSLKAGRQAG